MFTQEPLCPGPTSPRGKSCFNDYWISKSSPTYFAMKDMHKQPSGPPGPSQSNKQRKIIAKTSDLIKQNERDKRKGKGKEKEILGDMSGLMTSEYEACPKELQLIRFLSFKIPTWSAASGEICRGKLLF